MSSRMTGGAVVAFALLMAMLAGCSVLTVADAAVSVTATAVKAGASVVGTAVDVAGERIDHHAPGHRIFARAG